MMKKMEYIKSFSILFCLLFSVSLVSAETQTSADVTEKDAGATHLCGRNNTACTYDPRSDINSDGGSDDDIVYWDSHGGEWKITNDISTCLLYTSPSPRDLSTSRMPSSA